METDRIVTLMKKKAKDRTGDEKNWQELRKPLPFQRRATPEEIGAMAAFWASPLSGDTSGSVVTIDAGLRRAQQHFEQRTAMPHLTHRRWRELHHEETGKGIPVVFIHEFAGDYRSWEQQVRYFGCYYRCIAVNARGDPPSDVPKDGARSRRSARATIFAWC